MNLRNTGLKNNKYTGLGLYPFCTNRQFDNIFLNPTNFFHCASCLKKIYFIFSSIQGIFQKHSTAVVNKTAYFHFVWNKRRFTFVKSKFRDRSWDEKICKKFYSIQLKVFIQVHYFLFNMAQTQNNLRYACITRIVEEKVV